MGFVDIAIEKWGLRAIVDADVRRSFAAKKPPAFLDVKTARRARKFHQSLPGYKPTPLNNLSNLARELGVGNIYVKDESARFGLNAFKVLGSSYALGKLIGQRLGMEDEELTFAHLCSQGIRKKLGRVTFATATDGNHGRGVAWTAQQLGQPAVVYLPRGVARYRVEAIEETGAKAVVTDVNYDDTVRLIVKTAEEKGWQLVQDTAWEGYEEIPRWIMQGYTTMAVEIDDQLEDFGLPRPTHVFLQAGVGSFASTILGYFVNRDGEEYPRTIIMEPEKAACIFASALAGKEEPQRVTGDLTTIMAGLSCGEPSPLAWNIIHSFADGYVVCPDYVAAQGTRILAHPLGDDQRLVAGESGSVGMGLLSLLFSKRECAQLKERLGLDESSSVLLINTEGDTDPVNYRHILWDGKYPLP
ncbi:MAG: diaminopropionate ammonia-lyase [Firmicutes bacterium]|nr:diaminopropionate ammonia-lyase [Bacillota bacterium]